METTPKKENTLFITAHFTKVNVFRTEFLWNFIHFCTPQYAVAASLRVFQYLVVRKLRLLE